METLGEQFFDIYLAMLGYLHPTKMCSTWHCGFHTYWVDRDFGDEHE